jgi:hypothetical protein
MFTHGTTSGYSKRGCRCALCRSAWAAKQRRYTQRQRKAVRVAWLLTPAAARARAVLTERFWGV